MTTADLALIRGLFLKVLHASDTLGIDAEFRTRVKSTLRPAAALQGRPVGQPPGAERRLGGPGSRAPPRLASLRPLPGRPDHPVDTPDLAAAARRSLELRGDEGTGWSKAWKINLWARLLDGDHAYRMLRTHLRYVDPTGTTRRQWRGHLPQSVRRPSAVPDRRQFRRHRRHFRDAAPEPPRLAPPPAGVARVMENRLGAGPEGTWRVHRRRAAGGREPRGSVRPRGSRCDGARPLRAVSGPNIAVTPGRPLTLSAGPAGLAVK